MKKKIVIAMLCLTMTPALLQAGLMMSRQKKIAQEATEVRDPLPGVAVVELFTVRNSPRYKSADWMMRRLSFEATKSRARLYALAFHVDYARNTTDPLSTPVNTRRHYMYSKARDDGKVTAPQMVVNGNQDLGENAQEAVYSVAKTLQTPSEIEFRIEGAITPDGRHVVLKYDAKRVPKKTVLNIALVDDGMPVEGKMTEKNLPVVPVVLGFVQVDPHSTNGRMRIDLGDELRGVVTSAIAYVQRRDDLIVLGADRVDLLQ